MTESENSAFERVSEIITEFAGVDRTRITNDSDLFEDFGIAGDDGDDLFTAFDNAFDVDWTGLDLGVHFGGEGFGLPFPWQLKNDCVMYETQPCKVSDIVQAVESGRWQGTTKLILCSKSWRVTMYLLSAFQYALILGILIAVVWVLFMRHIG